MINLILVAAITLYGYISTNDYGVIGVRINCLNNKIIKVYEGSPAEPILKVGDRIIKSKDGSGKPGIDGPPFTLVTLTIKREGGRIEDKVLVRVPYYTLTKEFQDRYEK